MKSKFPMLSSLVFPGTLFLILSSFGPTLNAALSLSECQCLALENNADISIEDLRVCIAKDRLDEVKGIAYPTLRAHGDFIIAGDVNQFFKHQKKCNAKASLIVPLYNFGGASNLIEAQRTLYEGSFLSSDWAKEEILYAVSQAYYRLLESYKIKEIVTESIATLKEQLRIAQDFYSQGLLHKNDVLLLEVQLAQREQDAIQADHNINLSLTRLNRLMGIDLCEPTEIEDILDRAEWDENLCEIITEAKACHPELLALQTQIQAAGYAYEAEKGALFPAIYAFSDYSTTNDYALPYVHGVDVGIGVDLQLYDGGITRAKIRKRKKEQLELQYRYDSLLDDIELAIRSAYLQAESAAAKIPLAEKAMRIAEESLNITREHYQEGLVTTYDLLNDEERLAQARSNYTQALYDFHKAFLDLSHAAGILQQRECLCFN